MGDCIGRFIRAPVEVDITKPLERGFDLDVDEDEAVSIMIRYERLPVYCYNCGKIDHKNKECSNNDQECEI